MHHGAGAETPDNFPHTPPFDQTFRFDISSWLEIHPGVATGARKRRDD